MRMRIGVCHHDRPLRLAKISSCNRPMHPLRVSVAVNCEPYCTPLLDKQVAASTCEVNPATHDRGSRL